MENIHRQELAAFDTGTRPCGVCGMRNIDFVPSSVPYFKIHTRTVHGIRLRPSFSLMPAHRKVQTSSLFIMHSRWM
jgi:hypothetical protein